MGAAIVAFLGPVLAPLLSGFLRLLSGGLLDQIMSYLKVRADADVQRAQLDTQAAIATVQAELEARRAAAEIVKAEQGWWLTAMIRPLFVFPLGLWWCAKILDAIGWFPWQVRDLPPPMDGWASWIVAAYFVTAPFLDRRRR